MYYIHKFNHFATGPKRIASGFAQDYYVQCSQRSGHVLFIFATNQRQKWDTELQRSCRIWLQMVRSRFLLWHKHW
jgi:hypothetical protein